MDSVQQDPELALEAITLFGRELKGAKQRILDLKLEHQSPTITSHNPADRLAVQILATALMSRELQRVAPSCCAERQGAAVEGRELTLREACQWVFARMKAWFL